MAFAAVVAGPGSTQQMPGNITSEVSSGHHNEPVWGAVSGWGVMGLLGNYVARLFVL